VSEILEKGLSLAVQKVEAFAKNSEINDFDQLEIKPFKPKNK
jgi:hypothetical protein